MGKKTDWKEGKTRDKMFRNNYRIYFSKGSMLPESR